MREFNVHQGGRKPSVCHSCWRCGLVSPELGRGGSAGGQLLPVEAAYPPQTPTSRSPCGEGAQPKSRPLLSLGGVEVPLALCRQHPKSKRKRAQGGQVELSLTPCSHHLCLSLRINTITLNPQAEQRELFLFKGNIKSL